jgi:hypothetical protein
MAEKSKKSRCSKVPKIGPNGLFERRAQNTQCYVILTDIFLSPGQKWVPPPFRLGFPKIPYPF